MNNNTAFYSCRKYGDWEKALHKEKHVCPECKASMILLRGWVDEYNLTKGTYTEFRQKAYCPCCDDYYERKELFEPSESIC